MLGIKIGASVLATPVVPFSCSGLRIKAEHLEKGSHVVKGSPGF